MSFTQTLSFQTLMTSFLARNTTYFLFFFTINIFSLGQKLLYWKFIVHKANKITFLVIFYVFRTWRSPVSFITWKSYSFKLVVYIDYPLLSYDANSLCSSPALCLKALLCVCTQWLTSEMSSMDPSLTNMVTTISGHPTLAKSLTLAQGLWVLLMKTSLISYCWFFVVI